MVNEYLESMAASKPDKYIWIDTWSKLLSTKGHAMKQTSDLKGVHVKESGKNIIINTITNASGAQITAQLLVNKQKSRDLVPPHPKM